MFILFDLLFLIYIAFYLPILLLRGKWHDGFKERFGFFPSELKSALASGKNIWIHAVSVGEVIAVGGLIQALKSAAPDKRIVLSVTTKTGHSLAKRKYQNDVILIWSPLDLSLTVRAFVNAIRPVIYIAAETELWPNLFQRLSQGHVQILVVNGRISDKAYPRYRLVRLLLKDTLRRVRLFCMQSALDAERIISLGADKASVKMVGNIKFDNVPDVGNADPHELGFEPKDMVLVGGSTHPGEEEILLDIFQSLRPQFLDLKLVLAPRHPERSPAIAELVTKSGLKPILFSKNTLILRQNEVLIVDTIGHLLGFYSVATVVFVGKSLTVKGGHNIIEPAIFGKPIVIGQHMQNFKDIAQVFLADNAVIQVEDAVALKKALLELLTKPDLRRDLGDRARLVVRKNRGATVRTIDIIRTFFA